MEKRVLIEHNGKYGFTDANGEIVIPCIWKYAYNFSDGLAAVQNDDEEWGYIDDSGNLTIPCQYEYAGDFVEGLATVNREEDFYSYYIDKENNDIVSTIYNQEQAATIYRSITLAKESKFEEAFNCIKDIAYHFNFEDICPLSYAIGYVQESHNYTELFKLVKRYNSFFESRDGKGSGWACTQLGLLYENGLGVERDIKEAFSYYDKAAWLGDEEGKERLDKLIEKYPDLKGKSIYYNFEDEDWG
ncbi:MAG: WG repeat-containing protein [Bacteroidaceae bacterium]|nr:WG repeat-containing protein [Bacteroidaceae bacterium]